MKIARDAGPMDDAFFAKLGEDPRAIEEVISTVLKVPVKVMEVIPRHTLTNVGSRGVKLDNYSEIMFKAELL